MNELVGFVCQLYASCYHSNSQANLAETCLRKARCPHAPTQCRFIMLFKLWNL